MGSIMKYFCNCMQISIVNCPVLEYLSATAITATFVREALENTLPSTCYFIPIFAVIPSILVTLNPNFRSHMWFAMLRALSVGYIAGCMSFIVDVQDDYGQPFYTGPGAAGGPILIRIVFSLEILHVLVLLACLTWTIIHLCEQTSCLGRIPLAVGGAICGEFILLMIMASFRRLQTDGDDVKTWVTVFFIIFLLAMIPCMPSEQRAVIITWLAVFLNFLWQTSKWDKTVWNWASIRFPVPGGLTAHMLVMLTSEPHVSGQVYTSPDRSSKSPIFTIFKGAYRLLGRAVSRFGNLLAFVVAFSYFRISLSLRSEPYYPEERWVSSGAVILCYMSLQWSRLQSLFSSSGLAIFGICQAILFVNWSFAARFPLNCHVLDTLLGLTLLVSTRKAIVHYHKSAVLKNQNLSPA